MTDHSSPKTTTPNPSLKATPPKPQLKEGQNLALLGLGAVCIAVITTVLSLYIYHASGDIYLDRSRPGFLPDDSKEEEKMELETTNYKYPENGPIDQKSLEEYLSRIKEYQKDLDDIPDPFSAYPLSDKSLGIPEASPQEE